MMSTAPPLTLTRDQALRLQTYIKIYRQYAFASFIPSIERNMLLRTLQMVQGTLIACMDQKRAMLFLNLTREEIMTLKEMALALLSLFAKEPESATRIATVADLAQLKIALERSCRK